MALPILVRLPAIGEPPSLTLPGGVTLQQHDLLKVLQPALTPLMPVFNILDAVIAVFNTVKAIPESLGPPPDPTKLVGAIVEMTKKVSKLLRLVPQLALPYTVIGVVDVVLDTLQRVRTQLAFLQLQARQLELAVERAVALNDAGLRAVVECAQANIAQEANNLSKGLAGANSLLALLNIFLGMVGGPTVPDLSSLDGKPLDEVLSPLDELVSTLQRVRSAIPVP